MHLSMINLDRKKFCEIMKIVQPEVVEDESCRVILRHNLRLKIGLDRSRDEPGRRFSVQLRRHLKKFWKNTEAAFVPGIKLHSTKFFLVYFYGSRESAPTNNRKFTSDKRQQAQGKCAGARSRAHAQPKALV